MAEGNTPESALRPGLHRIDVDCQLLMVGSPSRVQIFVINGGQALTMTYPASKFVYIGYSVYTTYVDKA
jgi:hypothetical protein